ncbi:MAG: NADP-dependent 3-hydroxy acid dehydrogenase YdfG [Bermanella sp.]|jgi:NADP-dependent 3-hydroxy acid dehydrogenase YdfG
MEDNAFIKQKSRRMTRLLNKVVVITGAGSGIGRALAVEARARGARLALVDVNQAGLLETAALCKEGDAQLSLHEVDVSDKEAMRALPALVVERHGHVDILINNAGVSVGAMFRDHSIEDTEWLLDINFKGVVYGCKFFLPYLEQRPEAHIVNLSSMFGLFAMPGQAMYSASKAAVRFFSEALWTELAETSVRVTTVHPGTIKSRLITSSRMADKEAQRKTAELQERFGMPAERAAKKILSAVERNKLRVLLGMDASLSELAKRIAPVGFQRLITWLFQRSSRNSQAQP